MAEPITFRSIRETQQRVREGLAPGTGAPVEAAAESTVETHWVKITSTTQAGGRYPAKRWEFDANDATFSDPDETCWVATANGESLMPGIYYVAKLAGPLESDGLLIYLVGGVASAAPFKAWITNRAVTICNKQLAPLVATLTEKIGCCTDLPDSTVFTSVPGVNCADPAGWTSPAIDPSCGAATSAWSIDLATGNLTVGYDNGTPGEIVVPPTSSTAEPFSAVYEVSIEAGACSFMLTVMQDDPAAATVSGGKKIYVYDFVEVELTVSEQGCPRWVAKSGGKTGTARHVNNWIIAGGIVVDMETVLQTVDEDSPDCGGPSAYAFDAGPEFVLRTICTPNYGTGSGSGTVTSTTLKEFKIFADNSYQLIRDIGVCCECSPGCITPPCSDLFRPPNVCDEPSGSATPCWPIGGLVITECCPAGVPGVLYATIGGMTGNCACYDGKVIKLVNPSLNAMGEYVTTTWRGILYLCDENGPNGLSVDVYLKCGTGLSGAITDAYCLNAGQILWELSFQSTALGVSPAFCCAYPCDPLRLVFACNGLGFIVDNNACGACSDSGTGMIVIEASGEWSGAGEVGGGGGGGGGSSGITVGTTTVSGGTSGELLTIASGLVGAESLAELLDALGGDTGTYG